MGSWPTLQLQVAPGYSPTEVVPSGAWVDAVDHMRSANPKRGRQRQLDDFTTGTMPLVLSSLDGLLDPLDPTGPYYGLLQPGMPARLQAVWSGTTYPLWFGFADAFELDWPGNRDAAVNLPCSDVLGQLAIKKVNDAGYARLVLSDTPASYWRLGDPIGSTVAADSSGNGHDATVVGTTYFGIQGVLMTDTDTAMSAGDFEGYLNCPSGASIVGAGAFTIEMWANIGDQPVAGSTILLFQQDAARTTDEISIAVHVPSGATNGTIRCFYNDAPDINDVFLESTSAISNDGKWHHIVWTRAADGVTNKLYIDGVLEATATASGPVTFTAQQLSLAAGWPPPPLPFQARLDGSLDEVAIYPTALSAADIAAHHAAGAVPWDSQTTGERIDAIADVVQVPSSRRNIDVGTIVLAGVTQPLTDQFALPAMQTVAKSERGRLFAAADGDLTFHDADRDAAHATSLGTFTDADLTTGLLAPGALPYQPGGIKPRLDLVEVNSEVQVTRAGGVTQIARDARQPPPYGNRSLELSDLPLRDDGQAATLAAALLAARKDPKWRIDKLVLDPRASDALWPHVLGREIGDLITVRRRPPTGGTIIMSCRIEGVEHKIDANKRTWLTTWTLATNLFVSTDATTGWDAGEWDTPSFHWV